MKSTCTLRSPAPADDVVLERFRDFQLLKLIDTVFKILRTTVEDITGAATIERKMVSSNLLDAVNHRPY